MGTQRTHAGKAPCRKCGEGRAVVQRLAAGRTFAPDGAETAQVHPGVLRPSAGGQPLPSAIQAKMEAAFGDDFSEVRVHHGGGEAESIGAAAFTRGTHIHFGLGFYQPHTPAGHRLLGHELAHVVQQRAGRVRVPAGRAVPINDDIRLEREADALGTRAARSVSVGEARFSASPTAGTGTGPIQPVWIWLKNGKVQYNWLRDVNNPPQDGRKWVWMEADEFRNFKNAGKRTASEKWTDPVTGRNYYSADKGKTFFSDKKKQQPVTGLDPTRMLDRTRLDRTKMPIALYDVATYREAQNRETTGDGTEHDHIPSGESRKIADLKQGKTDAKNAYMSALAIEIRGKGHSEGSDHKLFSPTYAARQHNTDTVEDGTQIVSMRRPAMDAEYPEAAVYRDVKTMLTLTNRPSDGLLQTGGYRYMIRQNLKLGVLDPNKRGLRIKTGDPLKTKLKGGGVTYEPDPSGKTQLELIDDMLLDQAKERLNKPGGSPWTVSTTSNTMFQPLQGLSNTLIAQSSNLNPRTNSSGMQPYLGQSQSQSLSGMSPSGRQLHLSQPSHSRFGINPSGMQPYLGQLQAQSLFRINPSGMQLHLSQPGSHSRFGINPPGMQPYLTQMSKLQWMMIRLASQQNLRQNTDVTRNQEEDMEPNEKKLKTS